MASSKTEQRQSLQHRRVNLLAHYDSHRRRREQPLVLHIPAGIAQDGLASGSQGRDIGHLCASYKGPAGGRREAKQVQQPAEYHILKIRRYRREIEQARILIPGIGQQVSADSYRQRASDDTTKETPPMVAIVAGEPISSSNCRID